MRRIAVHGEVSEISQIFYLHRRHLRPSLSPQVTAPEAVAAATALCVKTNPACKPKAAAGLRLHQSPFRGVGAQQAHAFLDRELPKLLGGAGMSLPESLAGVKFDAQEVVQGMAGKDVDVRELYI